MEKTVVESQLTGLGGQAEQLAAGPWWWSDKMLMEAIDLCLLHSHSPFPRGEPGGLERRAAVHH